MSDLPLETCKPPFGDDDFVPFGPESPSLYSRDNSSKLPRSEKPRKERHRSSSRSETKSSRLKKSSQSKGKSSEHTSERSSKREKLKSKDSTGDKSTRESRHSGSKIGDDSVPNKEDLPENTPTSETSRSKQRDSGSTKASRKECTSARKRGRERSRSRSRSPSRGRARGKKRDGSRSRSRSRNKNSNRARKRYKSSSRSPTPGPSPSRSPRGRSWSRSYSSGLSRSRSRSGSRGCGPFRRRSELYSSNDRGFSYRYDNSRYRSPSLGSDVVPLDERPRMLNNWDIPPEGYENESAASAKTTGNFPLPCHIAVAKLLPGNAQHMQLPFAPMPTEPNLRPGMAMMAGIQGIPPSVLRQQRRVYVGNLPKSINDTDILEFFNTELKNRNLNPTAASAIFGGDRSFAFVEFKDHADATAAMSLEGATFLSQILRVRRPKDYVPPPGEELPNPLPVFRPPTEVGATQSYSLSLSQQILNQNNPDKLFIGGIPHNLTESQMRELLESMGELKAFHLVIDPLTKISRGFAFCEFVDTPVTDLAIASLNNMEIGERRLIVQRASSTQRYNPVAKKVIEFSGNGEGAEGDPKTGYNGMDAMGDHLFQQHIERENGDPALNNPGALYDITTAIKTNNVLAAAGSLGEESEVIMLLNLVTPEISRTLEDLQDIILDVFEECSKFGSVKDVIVPTRKDCDDAPFIPKVYVVFSDIDSCSNVLRNVSGKRYYNRTVVAAYFNADRLYQSLASAETVQ